MAVSHKAPLADRIADFHVQLESFIAARAHEVHRATPGVPYEVILRTMMGPGCLCIAAKRIIAKQQADEVLIEVQKRESERQQSTAGSQA